MAVMDCAGTFTFIFSCSPSSTTARRVLTLIATMRKMVPEWSNNLPMSSDRAVKCHSAVNGYQNVYPGFSDYKVLTFCYSLLLPRNLS